MFKNAVFCIIEPDRNASLASRIFDWLISGLIIVSVMVVFATTFELPSAVINTFAWIESFASIVFTCEYILRIWTADLKYSNLTPIGARFRYVVSGMAIVDLVSILPFWLPMFLPGSLLGLRAIRLARLLRILKLNRYSEAVSGIGDVIYEKRREILGSFFFVSLLMLVSSLVIYAVEHEAQPEVFKNAFSGLWWAVATLSTVGYGDIYPVTVAGRIFGAVLALLGVAAVAVPTSIISSGLIERVTRRQKPISARGRFHYCPYCGKKLDVRHADGVDVRSKDSDGDASMGNDLADN